MFVLLLSVIITNFNILSLSATETAESSDGHRIGWDNPSVLCLVGLFPNMLHLSLHAISTLLEAIRGSNGLLQVPFVSLRQTLHRVYSGWIAGKYHGLHVPASASVCICICITPHSAGIPIHTRSIVIGQLSLPGLHPLASLPIQPLSHPVLVELTHVNTQILGHSFRLFAHIEMVLGTGS